MAKINPWKIGIGSGAVIFGVYSFFNFQDFLIKIFGVIFIAVGIGLLASN